MFDRYLNGVNLAVHVKDASTSSSLTPLLQYYSDHGSLLEIDYKDNLTAEEVQKIHSTIIFNMKNSDAA
jgi:hypothetical protein